MIKPLLRKLLRQLLYGAVFFQVLQVSTSSAYAKDVAVVFGGGCDDVVAEKMDKPSFRDLTRTAKSLRNHGWEVRGYYGRSEWLEDFARDSGIKSAELANKQNLIRSLDYALSELKHGDQFLMIWDTHGSRQIDEYGHAICTADDQSNSEVVRKFLGEAKKETDSALAQVKLRSFLKSLIQDGHYTEVNDPALRGRLMELRRRGVKIGIVDDSCYGGATVLSLGDIACVISATTNFQGRPDGSNQGVSIALSGVLESGFSAFGTPHPEGRGSLEDAFLLRLLTGRGGRTVGSELSTDTQSSSFISWFDQVRKGGNGCESCKSIEKSESTPVMNLVSKSAPALTSGSPQERCRILAGKAARAIFIGMGADSRQADQFITNELIKELFDEEKCVAYLKHRDELTSGAKEQQESDRFRACEGFKL